MFGYVWVIYNRTHLGDVCALCAAQPAVLACPDLGKPSRSLDPLRPSRLLRPQLLWEPLAGHQVVMFFILEAN